MKKPHFVLLAALVLGLAACRSSPASGSGASSGSGPRDHSVVVAGHLYSLYSLSRKSPERSEMAWQAPLEALAEDLTEIGPEAVFFLGDSTCDSSEAEWDFVEGKLAGVEARTIFLAGNHEYRDIDRFLARGGVRNASVVIAGNKYILLDAKMILEPHDLAFLERELADHASYDNVFVLMHYALAAHQAPDREIDPYRPYSGVSNWTRDVAPLLAGKVDYVFCGDLYARVHRAVQRVGDEEINYVLNSFGFGRGDGSETTGDGVMMFLELRFRAGELSIVPHAVSIDVRHSWYRHFRDLDS